ncbi:MAG: porin [Rickettsiaceae bacterium]
MTNLKRILLMSASVFAFTNVVIAEEAKKPEQVPVVSDLAVKLSGFAHFQSAYRNQNKLEKDEKNVSANKKNFAFYSQAALVANISNQVDEITYGGRIVLVPTTKAKGGTSYNGSHIYLESEFGKVEAGSPSLPSQTMSIGAGDITAASLTDFSSYAKFDTDYLTQRGVSPTFATSTDFFLDSALNTTLDSKKYSSEPSRSVVYYTPKFDLGSSTKIQVGISYTPDSSNTGADKASTKGSGVTEKIIDHGGVYKFKMDRSVTDAFTGGICIEQNFSDGVDLKVALTGEYGKSAGSAQKFAAKDDTDPTKTFKLSDLKAYSVGAVLNVGNISYAGSYGSLGNSLTTPELHKTGRKTEYYTGAVAYKQGPFTASAGYFKSFQFKNTVDAVSLGTSYKLAPGFKPYASITGYTAKGAPVCFPDLDKKTTRGTVFVLGAKMSL